VTSSTVIGLCAEVTSTAAVTMTHLSVPSCWRFSMRTDFNSSFNRLHEQPTNVAVCTISSFAARAPLVCRKSQFIHRTSCLITWSRGHCRRKSSPNHSSYRSRSALLRRSTGHVFRKISASLRYSPVHQTLQTGSLSSLMPSVSMQLINIARCNCANGSCQLEGITDGCRRRRWMLKDSIVNLNDADALLADQKTMLRTGRCVDVRTESS